MHFLKSAMSIACAFCISVYAKDTSDTRKHTLSSFESIVVGAGTGASEVITGRPLDFFKSMRFLKKTIPSNPLKWYAGTSTHVCGIIPTTIFQSKMKSSFENVTDKRSADALAGFCSTIISCPIERIILEQQILEQQRLEQQRLGRPIKKQSLSTMCEKFTGTAGIRNLYKGSLAIGFRELLFTTGYMGIMKDVENAMNSYIHNPVLQAVGAGLCAGIPLALMSHPFESIRMWQQQDKGRSIFNVLCNMRHSKEGLFESLFVGAQYRTMRYCFALIIMGKTYNYMLQQMEQRSN